MQDKPLVPVFATWFGNYYDRAGPRPDRIWASASFLYSDMGDGSTACAIGTLLVRAQSAQVFPAIWAAFGDFLFRVGFLDRQYADWMRGTLKGP